VVILSKMKKIIKEKGFILRYPKLEDVGGYYETETDPISKKMFMSFPANMDEAKKDLQKHIKDNKKKPLVSETFTIEVGGKYAGYAKIQFQNFDSKGNEGRIHISIHPEFRGKGLATKVIGTITEYGFEKYNFKKIFAQCKFINKAVARVNEKAGFKLVKIYVVEGVKKMLWVLERLK
jgi:RimJ/RimL family protein N-acetyltransferase